MRIAFVDAIESSRVALKGFMTLQKRPGFLITLPHDALLCHSDRVDLAPKKIEPSFFGSARLVVLI